MALKISKNRQAYFNQVVAERVWGSGELERKGIVAVEFSSVFFCFALEIGTAFFAEVPSQILGVYQLYLMKWTEKAG